MRNKSLIFLALITLGITGCNKEASNTDVAATTETASTTAAAPAEATTAATVDQQKNANTDANK